MAKHVILHLLILPPISITLSQFSTGSCQHLLNVYIACSLNPKKLHAFSRVLSVLHCGVCVLSFKFVACFFFVFFQDLLGTLIVTG